MDSKVFDQIARRMATSFSRRGLWGIATGATLGAAVARLPLADAKMKRRKKKQRQSKKQPKLRLNDFQCVDVGQACRGNDANCCSGICQGKKPKKGKKDKSACVAHNAGICQSEQDQCVDDLTANCGGAGRCFRTTGNASFCGNEDDGLCTVCAKDADCEAAFGPGAACIVCSTCEIEAGSSTACVPPAA